jgi:fructosamine-3-kinase
MKPELQTSIESALGSAIRDMRPVSGGNIHAAYRLTLTDGRRVFVKTKTGSNADIFPTEARGIALLGQGPLRVPKVIVSDASFLALEWIDSSAPARDADEKLGRGLAQLHRIGTSFFGLDHDNFLASIPQDNTRCRDWPSFYGERRLVPLLRRVRARGLATPHIERRMERVLADLTRLSGPEEPPALLHGDLWSGNLLHDERGLPVLIDPAVYGGHREVDLAMMRLFGGFSPTVFEAYADEWPLCAGHEERVALYQLVPLLAHVVLFGGSYVGALESALDRIHI